MVRALKMQAKQQIDEMPCRQKKQNPCSSSIFVLFQAVSMLLF